MVPIVATAGTATAIVKVVLVVVIQLGITHDNGGSSGSDASGSSGGGGSGGSGGGGGYRKSGGILEGVVNGSREGESQSPLGHPTERLGSKNIASTPTLLCHSSKEDYGKEETIFSECVASP
ncbi:hypothetical protein HZH66_008105 [Vespula vulgaris]|uniref:Uncharacterized protein n=1 Tax=Vespula vulgaris TaxID=7454 RepID=A0A834JWH2_VESVU|nr:hypothetical protein HZH66_008105 [Vespula vulgaris]